jgi:Ni/Co efflux regulator RcnB
MQTAFRVKFAAILVAAGALAVGPVFADKPEWAGGGKPGKHAKEKPGKSRGDNERGEDRRGHYFDDNHRGAVRAYFDDSHRVGRCPPGLAKKHNGCLPPGQAKKWTMGRPLPRDVIYYELPPAVVVRLGTPPTGHKFVRVAGDILLIAIGTGMVIDAIEDLGRQ